MNISLKSLFFITITAISTSLFYSCGDKNNSGGVAANTSKENDIAWNTAQADTIYYLENDKTKPSCSLELNYVYPQTFSDQEILSKIQREIALAFFESAKYTGLPAKQAANIYIEDYVANYRNEAGKFFAREKTSHVEDYYSFSKKIESTLIFSKANIISYQAKSYDDKGGANSSRMYKNLVLDLSTGQPITEYDIFLPEYKHALNKILTDKIIAQSNVQTMDSLLDLGYWCVEDLDSNNNFFVNEEGITYIYNEGECAAPSIGAIIVPISFTELREILNEESILSSLF